MIEFTISDVAKACGGKLFAASAAEENRKLQSLVIDSRKVEKEGAFLATIGERFDGHQFISQVFEQGAALVVTQKTPKQVQQETGVDCSHWGSYILVENTLQALKDIAEYYRKKAGIPIVGITGSVGKTSTKEFVAGVLAQRFEVLKTEGNYNNEIGVPLTLLRIQPYHQVAVVEMGISDFGEMHRLSKMVRPNVCVITNIGQCHLENLKTRDGILKAKSEIFDFMAEDGDICLNGEDDKLSALQEIKGRRPHFFGVTNDAKMEVYADQIISHGLMGSNARLVFAKEQEESVEIKVPLPGKHMVLNAACAACVGKCFGMTREEIAEGITKIVPVSGRNNLIPLEKYTLIDDCYNANPASMKAAIDLLKMADTEKTAILGDMFELGDDSNALHGEIGRYAAEAAIDHIVCIGENAQYMFDEACAYAKQDTHVSHFLDLQSFYKALQEEFNAYIPKGSTVLIKASHGMRFAEILDYLKEQ